MKVEDQPIQNVELAPPSAAQTDAPAKAATRTAQFAWLGRLLRNGKAVVGLSILLFFVVVAIAAPIIAPGDPSDFVDRPNQPPSREHIFGTTGQGQDVFKQTVWGARISLGVGFAVGFLITVIGLIIGMTAAYFGGRIDDILSLITNIVLVIPGLPLLVTIAAFLPPGPVTILLVLSLTSWAWNARVFRSQTLSLREKDFVSASLVSGEGSAYIIFREILPNMTSLVAAAYLSSTLYGIGAEAGLEFLGLGNVSLISWGTILYWAGNNAGLLTGAWWTFVPAGLCIALVAFALAMANYAMDEITNPRLRAERRPPVLSKTARSATPEQRQLSEKRSSHSNGFATPLLDVRDLQVQYLTPRGPVRAVDGVSFTISTGEVFGLAGESGSGKSTIAHAMMRLLHPPAVITGGQVLFNGEDLLDMDDAELERFRWRDMSIVFQSAMNALNPVMTIGEQITDVIDAHLKLQRKEARDRAAFLLDLVGIESQRLNAYPHQLSGGMRQRAVIAIALALTPQLMIMDEPTTALDVVLQREILQQIEELKEKMGFSILFITHDLSLLVEFSTRIAIMYAGQIVELAPSSELFANPLHPYTQGLMNSFPSLTGPKTKLTGIPGAPPDMVSPPSGCRFHPRCALVKPRHTQVVPWLHEVSPGHFVACHLY